MTLIALPTTTPPMETRRLQWGMPVDTKPFIETARPQRDVLPHRPAGSSVSTTPRQRPAPAQEAFNDFVEQIDALIHRQTETSRENTVTELAYKKAFDHLFAAMNADLLLPGDLSPDGDGGLDIEWEQGNKKTTLFLHATMPRENYLYWQDGSNYGIETPPTPDVLLSRLLWLRRNEG